MNNIRYILLIIAMTGSAGLIYFAITRDKIPASISLEFPRSTANGQVFEVPLRISSTIPMNAAEFYFTFPAELIEVQEIVQTGSFFTLWIKDQPAFDNKAGSLTFAGGLPKPGFVGKNGLVATVKFTAKKRGQGTVILDSTNSRILANDGLGTKIEAEFEAVTFTIK